MPVARSALTDLIASVANSASTVEHCAHRAQQLREIAELRGHWWDPFSIEIADALGESEDVALEVVSRPAPGNAISVWVAFTNAALDDGYLRSGPIQFFGDQLSAEDLRGDGTQIDDPEFEPASELRSDVERMLEVPAQDYVLARIGIAGPHAVTPPEGGPVVDWARAIATDVLTAATFRDGGSAWRLLDGGVAIYEGGVPMGMAFSDPRQASEMRTGSVCSTTKRVAPSATLTLISSRGSRPGTEPRARR